VNGDRVLGVSASAPGAAGCADGVLIDHLREKESGGFWQDELVENRICVCCEAHIVDNQLCRHTRSRSFYRHIVLLLAAIRFLTILIAEFFSLLTKLCLQ